MGDVPNPRLVLDQVDVWHELEFLIAVEMNEDYGTVKFHQAWARKPSKDLPTNVRMIKVKLEVPESMWKLPAIRGKMKSDLKEEYEAFLKEHTD